MRLNQLSRCKNTLAPKWRVCHISPYLQRRHCVSVRRVGKRALRWIPRIGRRPSWAVLTDSSIADRIRSDCTRCASSPPVRRQREIAACQSPDNGRDCSGRTRGRLCTIWRRTALRRPCRSGSAAACHAAGPGWRARSYSSAGCTGRGGLKAKRRDGLAEMFFFRLGNCRMSIIQVADFFY